MYEQSACDYLDLGYPQHIVWPVVGWLIITVITPLHYKAQRDKNARELVRWRTWQLLDMQMRQRDVAASMQNTRKDSLMLKAENDAAQDVAAGRRQQTSSSLSSCGEPPPPPAWIMPPRLARHR